jgi:hypothetical protein
VRPLSIHLECVTLCRSRKKTKISGIHNGSVSTEGQSAHLATLLQVVKYHNARTLEAKDRTFEAEAKAPNFLLEPSRGLHLWNLVPNSYTAQKFASIVAFSSQSAFQKRLRNRKIRDYCRSRTPKLGNASQNICRYSAYADVGTCCFFSTENCLQ